MAKKKSKKKSAKARKLKLSLALREKKISADRFEYYQGDEHVGTIRVVGKVTYNWITRFGGGFSDTFQEAYSTIQFQHTEGEG